MFRQAVLINGVLFYSEAWHAIKENEVKNFIISRRTSSEINSGGSC